MRPSISIIIPAHNEEKRIPETLKAYCDFFSMKKKKKEIKDFEIVVVLNACQDKTIEVVKKFRKKYKEIKYLDFEMGGKGFAIVEGFKYSLKGNKELVGFVDADMATSPQAFYDLVESIGDYGGIIASRKKKGAVVSKNSLLRKITSWGFNVFVRTIFFMSFRDTQCGAKLFKKQDLERVIQEIGITGWAFDVNLLYSLNKKGTRIKEHPTVWTEKKESTLNITKVPVLMFLSLIRLRLLNSPFKGAVDMYNRLPEWIKIHHKLK